MRRRVKAIALATENVGFSPFLPLAAGLLITLFAVSLAMADPADELTAGSLMASQDALSDAPFESGSNLASDVMPPDDTAILSRPLAPPSYHDRFRFYHRYDHALQGSLQSDR